MKNTPFEVGKSVFNLSLLSHPKIQLCVFEKELSFKVFPNLSTNDLPHSNNINSRLRSWGHLCMNNNLWWWTLKCLHAYGWSRWWIYHYKCHEWVWNIKMSVKSFCDGWELLFLCFSSLAWAHGEFKWEHTRVPSPLQESKGKEASLSTMDLL